MSSLRRVAPDNNDGMEDVVGSSWFKAGLSMSSSRFLSSGSGLNINALSSHSASSSFERPEVGSQLGEEDQELVVKKI